MSFRTLAVFAVSLVIAGAMATAQTQNFPRNQKPVEQPGGTVNEAPDPSKLPSDSKAQPIDPHTYVIGAEDILKITVWRDGDLSGVVGVRPDGMITRPLIGDVQAAGLTPERLTAQLREGYMASVRNPEITVEVIQVNSKHYSITGGVNRPGNYPLVVKMTVFEALNLAGGFQEFAKKSDILILRTGGGKPLHFNWDKYANGKKDPKNVNVELQPGDTIIVKQ